MSRYIALVDGKKGAYGVVVPDLPGCYAMGKTIDEALRNAASAAVAWAPGRARRWRRNPQPRPGRSRACRPRRGRSIGHELIHGDRSAGARHRRPAKANLSLDAGLLEAIDEAAQAKGLTRSAFIASAAREKIVEDA